MYALRNTSTHRVAAVLTSEQGAPHPERLEDRTSLLATPEPAVAGPRSTSRRVQPIARPAGDFRSGVGQSRALHRLRHR